jgi:Uma2 family endonuclease
VNVPAHNEHRFTVKDYYRLAEIGVLKPDARVELLEGQVIDTPHVTPLHAGTLARLAQLFGHTAEKWLLVVRSEVVLNEYSQLQPDLMMVEPRSDYYSNRHPGPEDVYLLVEVSDTSLTTDREVKLPAYGRAGIPEVWIVNLLEQTIEVYREPHFSGYATKTVLRTGETAQPLAFSDVAIDVGELLKR